MGRNATEPAVEYRRPGNLVTGSGGFPAIMAPGTWYAYAVTRAPINVDAPPPDDVGDWQVYKPPQAGYTIARELEVETEWWRPLREGEYPTGACDGT